MSDESGVKHYDISQNQKASAEKLMRELNSQDQKAQEERQAEAAAAKGTDEPENVEEAARDKGQEVEPDVSGEKKEVEEVGPLEEEAPEAEGEEEKTPEGDADKKLSAEEAKILEQERMIQDEPPGDPDKTTPAAKKAWREQRLKIRQLQAENEKLRTQAPAVPLGFILSEAEAEKQAAQLEEDWINGRISGNVDYQQIEDQKQALRVAAKMSAIAQATRIQNELAAKREAMNAAIQKNQDRLPGLAKVFQSVVQDPLLGNHVLFGQIIERNLNRGAMDLLYFLHHHPPMAKEILNLPPDEAAVRLNELKTKLTKQQKATASDFRPSKPITNSQFDEQPRRGGEPDPVKAEMKRYRDSLYRR